MPLNTTPRTWRFPSRLIEEQVAFALMLWVGFLIVVAVLTVVVSRFTEIETSGWSQAGIQIPQWFALFVGGYVIHNTMPLYIAHGRTRKDFAMEVLVWVVIYAAALTLMVVAGFLVERVIYAVADWPQVLSEDDRAGHLFDSTRQYPAIFLEMFLIFLVWTTVGAFGGAAFYRGEEGAFFLLPLGLLPLLLVGVGVSAKFGPLTPLTEKVLDTSVEPFVAILLSLLAFVIAVAMTWPLLRALPVHTKAA